MPPKQNHDTKTFEPERFDGISTSSREFLVQVRLNLECCQSTYSTERSKCLFLLSLLKGAALKWATPFYEKGDPILDDFEQFAAALSHTFSHAEDPKVMMNKLYDLRQGADSVSTYIGNFSQLSSSLDLTQSSLMSHFERGLSDKIQDAMSTIEPPATLSDLMHLAERIEQRMERRALSKPPEPQFQHRAYHPKPPLKSLEISKKEDSEMQMKWEELDPRQQRYLYRALHKLCRYCGAADHQAFNCPNRRDDKPPLKGKGQSQH